LTRVCHCFCSSSQPSNIVTNIISHGKNPDVLAIGYPCSDYFDFGPIKGYGIAQKILGEFRFLQPAASSTAPVFYCAQTNRLAASRIKLPIGRLRGHDLSASLKSN
jgi:hypothetical protein